MSEEPGVSICEIRPATSGGISIRSRAALASSGEGSDRTVPLVPCTGALGFLFELVEVLDNVSGIDTTFQRNEAPSSCSSNRVNKCVPNGALGIFDLDGDIKQWRKALTYKEPAQFAAHEN